MNLKRAAPAVAAAIVVASITAAGSIKTWSTGETIRSTDLNAAFNHLHTYMVGGGLQGAPHNTLVNSDIASSAAIAHSKLATPGIVPKAWAGYVGTAISGTACDGAAAANTICDFDDWGYQKVTRVSSNGTTGQYRVYLSYVPSNASFFPQVTASPSANRNCFAEDVAVGTAYASGSSTAQFVVKCKDDAGANANSGFSVVVYDDNN